MARRLVDAGFDTSVCNRTAAKMQPLIEAGTEHGRALLGNAQQAGFGDEDFSALAKLMRTVV